jgi:nucleoside-diphosphate-sugar epimerase
VSVHCVVTGSAGFIGSRVTQRLLERGDSVVGFDNLNDYYDPALKRARLALLEGRPGFRFLQGDVADAAALSHAFAESRATHVVHLAAQEGADIGDELVGDKAQGDLSDIELMARNQLEQQIKGTIKV